MEYGGLRVRPGWCDQPARALGRGLWSNDAGLCSGGHARSRLDPASDGVDCNTRPPAGRIVWARNLQSGLCPYVQYTAGRRVALGRRAFSPIREDQPQAWTG